MKFLILLLLISCGKPTSNKGKTLYRAECISCHNANPGQPGVLGPDLIGSSFDLIKSKTQNGEYPPGYKPKRKTSMMPKIPLQDDEIKAIQEYIETFRK